MEIEELLPLCRMSFLSHQQISYFVLFLLFRLKKDWWVSSGQTLVFLTATGCCKCYLSWCRFHFKRRGKQVRVDYNGPIVSFERSKGKGLEGVCSCVAMLQRIGVILWRRVLSAPSTGSWLFLFFKALLSHPTGVNYQMKCRSTDNIHKNE